jgi:NAD(P)-dependent dehydrogenase (short-subunit alcohol dehydrogenase family)
MTTTFLITGGNTGIGYATGLELARRGERVYLACRSASSGTAAVNAMRAAAGNPAVSFLPLDLADLDSVRSCAAAFLALDEPLPVLINNAGVAGRQGVTAQGFELAFGVNHLGHFLLTSLLRERLVASAPARVVTVSSDAHYQARSIDWDELRRRGHGMTGMHQYAVSKLCNVLFAQELARQLEGTGVTTYAVHPGVVASDIWRRIPWPVRPLLTRRMLSVEEGAQTSLYCATSPAVAADTGRFYEKCAPREPSEVATASLAAELWRRSAEWTADYGLTSNGES